MKANARKLLWAKRCFCCHVSRLFVPCEKLTNKWRANESNKNIHMKWNKYTGKIPNEREDGWWLGRYNIYIYMHITIEESNTATHVLNWGVQPTSDSKPILYCLTGPSNHNWFCSSESPVINDKSSIAHGPLYIQETHQSGYMVVGQCPVPLLFTSPTKLFWLLGCSSWFLDG
jgi:hypothetical protein